MKTTKPIAILRTGSTFTELKIAHGDFDQWIASGLGDIPHLSIAVHEGADLPAACDLAGAVITGSHAMVTDHARWSENLAQWIRGAHEVELPLLGICYGHQLIAHALGGTVDYREQGMEIGTHRVRRSAAAEQDALFGQLPDAFDAHLVHSQSVTRVPPGATILASSDAEPHQGYRVGRSTWGVQFHPEFDEAIMRFYLSEVAKTHPMKQSPCGEPRETPAAASLLSRFVCLAP